MRKELEFLIYTQRNLHYEDPAFTRYFNIIEMLLMINECKTLEFIERIEADEDMLVIASHFPRLSGRFQSRDFIKRLEKVSEKFKISKLYRSILNNIEEAKDAPDEEKKDPKI